MRKIIVSEFYSLDGFMSDPKDQMEWVTTNFSKDLGKYEDDLYDSADTLFLGRDEFHLLVHPVVLAKGKPLFKNIKDRQNLKLVKTKTFINGVVLLRYQPKK